MVTRVQLVAAQRAPVVNELRLMSMVGHNLCTRFTYESVYPTPFNTTIHVSGVFIHTDLTVCISVEFNGVSIDADLATTGDRMRFSDANTPTVNFVSSVLAAYLAVNRGL